MCRRNEMVLIVARQQNGRALDWYDLENEIQDVRLDLVGAAKLVDGRVHLEKSGKRGCFRGLVGSGTIRRRIIGVGPVSLGIRERQQFLIDFVSEEVNKTERPTRIWSPCTTIFAGNENPLTKVPCSLLQSHSRHRSYSQARQQCL